MVIVSVVLVAIFAAFILVPLAITIVFFQKRKRSRRSPLTSNLLRGPGETLREEIEKATEKIDDFAFMLFFAGCTALLLFLVLISSGNGKVFIWQLWSLGVSYLLTMVLLGVRMYRLVRNRQDLYLGLDAELAVGQELNQLMLKGCHVFHDFPAEEFNIDHVVVAKEGVFAVETKGRAKPDKGRGAEEARVTYDGDSLRFPGWTEPEPLEQARRQAVWLSKWLSSSVGESVRVQPVLVLPGWYVERKAKADFLIFNGKNPDLILRKQQPEFLEESMIQRIVHQVGQRCRNVAPSAYGRKKKARQ